MRYRIHHTARKHGIDDADIRHAIEHALAVEEYEDADRVLYLGPGRAANMLEIITLAVDEEVELVIHAMPMRPKYRPLLRGLGEPDA
jgi:hypothetical protein